MSNYFNENLTKKKGRLFKEVRQAVKSKKLHSCWTIDGKIFTKKNRESTPIQINQIEDISKI